MRNKIFKLTPLGRADIELKEYLDVGDRLLDSEEFKKYQKELSRYRDLKILQTTVRILLYAGVITSVAASLGFEQIGIIERIASYLGVTFLIIAYITVNYTTMVQREAYHVRREILISNTEIKAEQKEEDKETAE